MMPPSTQLGEWFLQYAQGIFGVLAVSPQSFSWFASKRRSSRIFGKRMASDGINTLPSLIDRKQGTKT